jgi:hypothetical protein
MLSLFSRRLCAQWYRRHGRLTPLLPPIIMEVACDCEADRLACTPAVQSRSAASLQTCFIWWPRVGISADPFKRPILKNSPRLGVLWNSSHYLLFECTDSPLCFYTHLIKENVGFVDIHPSLWPGGKERLLILRIQAQTQHSEPLNFAI